MKIITKILATLIFSLSLVAYAGDKVEEKKPVKDDDVFSQFEKEDSKWCGGRHKFDDRGQYEYNKFSNNA